MIIRRRHTANFTTIGNALFNDERLEADELGVLAFLLSRPDDWEVRRPALARRFSVGRDSIRRMMRNLMCYGWIVARVTRLSNGTVHIIYEVRDEPGPELSQDEAKAALSLVSSDAGPGESETESEAIDVDRVRETHPPPTPQRGAADRLRQSHPGPIEDSLKTESPRTESTQGVRVFADVLAEWDSNHVLSVVACETLHASLADVAKEAAFKGAKPYLADCKTSNRKVCDLATYYRERRWERFQTAAQPEYATFKVHSPQWYRWREYKAAIGQSVAFMESYARDNPNGTCTEKTEWPPALPDRVKAEREAAHSSTT